MGISNTTVHECTDRTLGWYTNCLRGCATRYIVAAAEQLNIHHSTVLRRISALEKSLNIRLFYRHARGYEPTEAGNNLFQVAANIKSQLDNLAGVLQSSDEQIAGQLVVTTVDSFVDILSPWFSEFCQLHPHIQFDLRIETKRLRLDYGQTHIAIRPGAQPTEPGYIAQSLMPLSLRLYASKQYIKQHGQPIQVMS